MTRLLADINVIGYVEILVAKMQGESWIDFWRKLDLTLVRFDEVGLSATSSDLEIWRACQNEQLILITDNRNHDAPDSLEATIHRLNGPDCLPVFTIGDLDRFRNSGEYVERVLARFYDYLLRIDELRGAGRLFLP